MTSAAAADLATRPGLTDRRRLLGWEAIGFVWIMLAGSALHFVYELSSFSPVAAVFGSVNESTWEHLKLFFWPGLLFALVQHAFVKDYANNYWWGKALALTVTPLGVIVSFYFYLGIAIPMTGGGNLAFDIGTGAFGVVAGNVVSYRILTAPQRQPIGVQRRIAAGIIVGLTVLFSLLTFFPPRMFLFEDFLGYEFRGEYGILEDYSEHLVFSEPDI